MKLHRSLVVVVALLTLACGKSAPFDAAAAQRLAETSAGLKSVVLTSTGPSAFAGTGQDDQGRVFQFEAHQDGHFVRWSAKYSKSDGSSADSSTRVGTVASW